MSKAKPMVYIANAFTNRIIHRRLTRFDEENLTRFASFRSVHATWEDAHAWLLLRRGEEVQRARKEFARAERSFARARAMKKPEDA